MVERPSALVESAGSPRPTPAQEAQPDDVMSCKVGDYVVIVPRRAGSGYVTLARVTRDGRVGTILDGRFVTIEEARAALDQTSPPGPAVLPKEP